MCNNVLIHSDRDVDTKLRASLEEVFPDMMAGLSNIDLCPWPSDGFDISGMGERLLSPVFNMK